MNNDINKFITDSQTELNNIEPMLKIELEKILYFVKNNILNEVKIKDIMIQDRIKGSESLREKIFRKNYFKRYDNPKKFIEELPDLIGIRLVCLLDKEEEFLYNEISEKFSQEIDDGYFIIPKSDNNEKYLKIKITGQPLLQKNEHNIYKMDAQWINTDLKINMEIQIKSMVNMFWGEIEHMLFYKNYAYMMDNSFYKSFMNSTLEILHTVDYQLEIIKNQLRERNNLEEVQEIRGMATRLIYNIYQSDAHDVFGCNIDLKEAFELVIFIYFNGINDKEEALEKLSKIIVNTNCKNSKLNSEKLNIEVNNENNYNLVDELYEWRDVILNLIQEDIFWKTFFVVYKIVDENDDSQVLIDSITTKLASSFNSFKDLFDEGIDGNVKICCDAICNGILEFFKHYRKMDFFLISGVSFKVEEELKQFINRNKEDMYYIEDRDYNDIDKKILFSIISIIVNVRLSLLLNKKVPMETLIKLLDLFKSNNNFGNFGVEIEELEKYILGNTTDINKIFNEREV